MENKVKAEAKQIYNSSKWKNKWKAIERAKLLQKVKAEVREKKRIAREAYLQYALWLRLAW